jgi:hypothetical protein
MVFTKLALYIIMILHLVIGGQGKTSVSNPFLKEEQYVNAANRFTSMLSTD